MLLNSFCGVLRSSDCKHSEPKVLRTGKNSTILEKLLQVKWRTTREYLRVEAILVIKTNLLCIAGAKRQNKYVQHLEHS